MLSFHPLEPDRIERYAASTSDLLLNGIANRDRSGEDE